MEKQTFDFEAFKREAASRLKKGETLLGRDGVFTPLLKEFLEEALEGELEAHIEQTPEPDRKNGKGSKRVKTPVGNIEITTPRDRNGTFEPEIIPKRHKTLGVDLDRQIIALYARGASYADIRDHLMDMFGFPPLLVFPEKSRCRCRYAALRLCAGVPATCSRHLLSARGLRCRPVRGIVARPRVILVVRPSILRLCWCFRTVVVGMSWCA